MNGSYASIFMIFTGGYPVYDLSEFLWDWVGDLLFEGKATSYCIPFYHVT